MPGCPARGGLRQTVLEPKRGGVVVAAAATGKHSTLEEIPPGLPRRFVRTPYFAPDGPDPPAERPVSTAVSGPYSHGDVLVGILTSGLAACPAGPSEPLRLSGKPLLPFGLA
jgi:hypothetical protein